jgi:predicted nucleic acid-binding protein
MILLDTNVVVAFLNGEGSVLKRIKYEIDRIALSPLVIAERKSEGQVFNLDI